MTTKRIHEFNVKLNEAILKNLGIKYITTTPHKKRVKFIMWLLKWYNLKYSKI